MFEFNKVKYKSILSIEELFIPAGKTTCIIGESGCGKTTLLKLLNRMISVDCGTIKYRGTDIHEMNPIELRRKVVMLSQTPVIFDGNIKDNLQIGLKFAEKPLAAEEELVEAMKRLNLNKELTENAEKLSGGEKQRLALARLMLMQPEVLLLDEPSSALDDSTEHMIINQLIQFAKEHHVTVIIVTHSKDVARDFGENIIEICEGKVSYTGGDRNE